MRKEKTVSPAKLSLPNLITLLRIILTPLFVILVINRMLLEAVVVFSVAAVSDGLDGFLARTLGQKTVLGSYLDPIADKLLLNSAYLSLAIVEVLPSWLAVIVISRDLIILVGGTLLHLLHGPFPIRPLPVSKLTTCAQIATLLAVLLIRPVPTLGLAAYLPALYWTTAGLTVFSGLRYIFIGVRILTAKEAEGG
jgi:cardiolipin synthase